MQTTKKDLVFDLRELMEQWKQNGGWEIEEGNSNWGLALQQCSDELEMILRKHVDDIRELL